MIHETGIDKNYLIIRGKKSVKLLFELSCNCI